MNKSVKVTLLQDVPHLGQKDEVKSVAFGYAKNWLIPQKLASLATRGLIAQIEQRLSQREQVKQRERERYESLVQKLEGFVLRLRPKKTKRGTLYAAINEMLISQKLKEKGIDVEPTYINLDQPIKKVGEYEIPVILSENFKARVKVIVQ